MGAVSSMNGPVIAHLGRWHSRTMHARELELATARGIRMQEGPIDNSWVYHSYHFLYLEQISSWDARRDCNQRWWDTLPLCVLRPVTWWLCALRLDEMSENGPPPTTGSLGTNNASGLILMVPADREKLPERWCASWERWLNEPWVIG